MKKVLRWAGLGVMMVLLLTGCDASGDPNANVEAVAKVNGKVAPLWQYNLYVTQGKNYMSQYGVDFETDDGKSMLPMIEQQAWESVIANQIVVQTADELGIEADEAKVKQEFEDNLKSTFENDEDYQQWLTDMGLTEEQALEILSLQDLNTQIYDQLTADQGVTEEEAKTAYEEDPSQWDTRKVSHILISAPAATATEEERTAALEKATDLIARLQQGEDFATLAQEYSDDQGTSANGGVLDYAFTAHDTNLDGDFVTGSFELQEVGDISAEPVESSFGYHIIKLDEKTAGFEALKDTLMAQMNEDAKGEYFYEYLQKKRDEAKVERLITFENWTEGNDL